MKDLIVCQMVECTRGILLAGIQMLIRLEMGSNLIRFWMTLAATMRSIMISHRSKMTMNILIIVVIISRGIKEYNWNLMIRETLLEGLSQLVSIRTTVRHVLFYQWSSSISKSCFSVSTTLLIANTSTFQWWSQRSYSSSRPW